MGWIMNRENPRYVAFLRINPKPQYWEFAAFINEMVREYGQSKGLNPDLTGRYRIVDHEDFTSYIEARATELEKEEKIA